MTTEAKYVLGIDLGTTNSVLAYARLDTEQPTIEVLPVPQLVAPSTVETSGLLPSFLYLGSPEESKAGALDVPWAKRRDFAVGLYAQKQSAESPQRTVSGVKSWLCHARVDRRQPILPWQAPDEVPKISPVVASQRYLEHLAAAWEAAFPDAPVARQRVVLTVPASFDASARELTREAALAAGLPEDLVLLEEPQAALYAWLSDRGDRWRRLLKLGDALLVCDVGGGTTDLTLVSVAEENGGLYLERRAVGNHLLIGGDNMDLALAHATAALFAEKGVRLDPWQSVALWHACRSAKEVLLAPGGPDRHPVSILGRGARLIAKTISVELERAKVQEVIVEGFFPMCKITDKPARRRVSGFLELGLPFETDTAITRHVAAFLTAHGDAAGPVRPTHVLFNGGVFKAEVLRRRLLEVLASWFGAKDAPKVLEGKPDLDFAVARGAAYYGWAKQRGGVRIRGGTARAYYVGIETAGPAVPGAPRPLHALCVVPIGMEEGTETDVPSGEIGLVVGEPAQFRFFSSSVRKEDRPGTRLTQWTPEELVETAPLETMLVRDENIQEPYTPIRFHARITELGMLELWCVSTQTDRRWKLEFSVREEDAGEC
ncbi:MAG TPA: Hsp70 family protein [Thermoguttaceae bacterium]|nr:Hsp70 family protein [Thermoguttaceae bacterium]